MKKFIYILSTVMLLFSGCYKPEIEQIDYEIESLRNNEVASLTKQVESIRESVAELEKTSAEVKKYAEEVQKLSDDLNKQIKDVSEQMTAVRASLEKQISDSAAQVLESLETVKSALEAKLSDIDTLLSALKKKDVELEEKIDSLRKYADDTFATKDWMTQTFATIDKQKEIIADIAVIKADIETISQSTIKVEEEVKTLITTKIAEAKKNLSDELAAMVTDITKGYETALASAVSGLNTAYEKALYTSIRNSETKVMNWVNDSLKDYFTVAQAEAKIAAFKALTGDVPEGKTLQGQLDVISTDITAVKAQIEKEYTEAISKAIETSEGKLTEEMAEKILEMRKTYVDPLSKDVEELEGQVSELWKKLGALQTRVNTIDQQIIAINKSIAVLADLKMTLQEYVESIKKYLQEADARDYKAVKSIIDELNALANGTGDGSIQSQIDALKKYIGELPVGEESVAEWIKKSKNTIDEQFKLYETIAKVKELQAGLEGQINTQDGQITAISTRMSTIIEESKSTIVGWINTRLASYYTSADAQGLLDAIEVRVKGLFEAADKDLLSQIETLQGQLTAAKKELSDAYKSLIETSITELGGKIDKELESQMASPIEQIGSLTKEIAEYESRVEELQKSISDLNTDLGELTTAIKALEDFVDGYPSLKSVVDQLLEKLKGINDTYQSSLEMFNTTKSLVYGSDGKGETDGIMFEVSKIAGLARELEAAQQTIASIVSFTDGFDYETEKLQTMIETIKGRIEALQTEVITGDLRGQLDKIVVALYGEGKNPEDPSEDSIKGQLKSLSKSFLALADRFSSIAYIPAYTDGRAVFTYNGDDTHSAQFDFVVRPAKLASIFAAAGDCCTMKYVSTPTKAVTYAEFSSVKFEADNAEGRLTAFVTIREKERKLITAGASAALFVTMEGYEFVSDFIPMYLPSDSQDYYINPTSVNYLSTGGIEDITVYPEVDNTYTLDIEGPEWISVASHTSSVYHIQAAPSQSRDRRSTDVIFKFHKKNDATAIATRVLKVTQNGRDPQSFTGFDPVSGTITFDFRGIVVTPESQESSENATITVSVNDDTHDWSCETKTDWMHITKIIKKVDKVDKEEIAMVEITADKNLTFVDRDAEIIFTSATKDQTVKYALKQLARGTQALTFDPAIATGLTFDYKGDTKDITVTADDGETDWSIDAEASSSWISYRRTEGSPVASVTVAKYEAGRSGKLVFKAKGSDQKTYEYPIVQTARPEQKLSFSPSITDGFTFDFDEYYISRYYPNYKEFTVTADDGLNDWTYTVSNDTDFTVNVNKSTGTVQFVPKAKNNTASAKVCKITFTSAGPVKNEYVCNVTQKPRDVQTFTFSPESLSFDFDEYYISVLRSNAKTFTVSTNDGQTDWTYSVTKGSDYFDILKVGSLFTITFKSQNNDPTARECEISFTSGDPSHTVTKYSIVQKGRTPQTLGFNPAITSGFSFGTFEYYVDRRTTNYKSVTVTPSDNLSDWTVDADADWLKVVKSGNTVNFVPSSPNTGAQRSCKLIFTVGSGDKRKYECVITQAKRDPQTINSVTPSSIIYSGDGEYYSTDGGATFKSLSYSFGDYYLNVNVVTSDGQSDWKHTSTWTRSKVEHDGSKLVLSDASSNTNWNADKPTGTITVTSCDGASSKTINVSQNRTLSVVKDSSTKFSVKSDSKWWISAKGGKIDSLSPYPKSGNKADPTTGSTITVSLKSGSKTKYNAYITIDNNEGESKTIYFN